MKTRRISLKPVSVCNYQILFGFRNTESFRTLVHYNDSVVLYDEFVREFTKDARVRKYQYIIELYNGDIIGLIFSHSHSPVNGFCSVNVFIDDTHKGRGYGVEAFALLFCKIFEDPAFYKIYTEVFEYNKLSLSSIISSGLKEEGRFKGHKLLNGNRYDVIRFAGYRDSIPRFQRIIRHFT